MYRIAHISDSHICFNDKNGHGVRLVEVLSDIKNRNCDHIAITGDIVDNPELRDLVYAREILAKFDLMEYEKMSVIPGNHDIFGGASAGKDFFRFPMICKGINYDENLNNFIDSFKELFPEKKSLPYLKTLDNVAIIGINSIDNWSEDKNPEGSNGIMSKKDFKKLEKIFSLHELKNKFKIILIHHHFCKAEINYDYPAHSLWLRVINRKMKLRGKKAIIRLFKKHKVSLVLHGHTHINQIYNINEVSFINSSASCTPITDDQVRKYNIISIPGEADIEDNITVETITL